MHSHYEHTASGRGRAASWGLQPLRAAVLAIGLLLVSPFGLATEVIAHAANGLGALPRSAAIAAFSMRLLRWPNGLPVRVFVLREDHPEHQSLCKQVLDIYPYQLRDTWNRLVYTGTGQSPVIVGSEEEMIERIANTPGAIGYVSRAPRIESIHVIGIR